MLTPMGPGVDSEMAIMLASSWLVNQPVRCPMSWRKGMVARPPPTENRPGAEKLCKQAQVEHHFSHPLTRLNPRPMRPAVSTSQGGRKAPEDGNQKDGQENEGGEQVNHRGLPDFQHRVENQHADTGANPGKGVGYDGKSAKLRRKRAMIVIIMMLGQTIPRVAVMPPKIPLYL